MPYDNEAKSYVAINRIAKNKRIKDLYSRCRITEPQQALHDFPTLSPKIIRSDWVPQLALAIDGSFQNEQINNGFPGAEVGYVTSAAVIIKVAELAALDKRRPIDPRLYRKLEAAQPVDAGLPGANVILDDCISAEHSFRRALFETLRDARLDGETESLLDTYEALLAHRNIGSSQKCPYGDQCGGQSQAYKRGSQTYSCPCSKKFELFSTDALRISEGLAPDSGNTSVLGETTQVLERLLLINILRKFEQANWLELLSRVAILVDGPLAVFGRPAWLKDCIQTELQRINNKLRTKIGCDMLLIGIEKTGPFVEHLSRLDQRSPKNPDMLLSQQVVLLTDSYIKKYIICRESDKPYGSQTYFGRKWFYKTRQSTLLVCSLPFLNRDHADLTTAEPTQFPRLADALNTLDTLWSGRYPNAVTPIISAHAEATIPLNMGNKILRELAKEIIQGKLP